MKINTILVNRMTAIGVPGVMALFLGSGSVLAGDQWQERLLYNPPESQLRAEQRGRVMIYDGLKDTEVATVLDSQFDRIQSMMFVRTVVTDTQGRASKDKDTGEDMVEDDGC